MIIDRIVMKNYKRFRHQELRFRDGITGILGNNGTGKSTIVEAILFALYGVQSTGISSDYIVSSFAPPKEKCEVRLDFRVGGDEYTVLRTFRKGKTVHHEASFHKSGKLMADGVSQVETEVRRVLGMGPLDFRNTVYAAQKDLLVLLENTPGKRKEWFLRALGIDHLKTESDLLIRGWIEGKDRELRIIEGELKGLLGRHDPDAFHELERTSSTLRADLSDLQERKKELSGKKGQVTEELQQDAVKRTEHARLIERHAALSAELQGLVRKRESLSPRISGLPGLELEYRALEQRVSAIVSRREELESLRQEKAESERLTSEHRFAKKECEELAQRAEHARIRINSLAGESAHLISLVKTVREVLQIGADIPDARLESVVLAREAEVLHELGNLSARADRLVTERKALIADRAVIRAAGADGVCPLCRQKLGEHYGQIEDEFSSRLESIEQEAMKVCEEQERMTAKKERILSQKPTLHEIRAIAERLKALEPLEAELADLKGRLQARETAQNTLAERVRHLGYDDAAFTSAQKEVEELEKIQARSIELGKTIAHGAALKAQDADLAGQAREKETEITLLNDRIRASDFDRERGPGLEKILTGIETDLRKAESDAARTIERLRFTEEKIQLHKKERESIAMLKRQVAALGEEIELLRLTRSLIGEYVLYLMQVVRSRIEGEVSRIIGEITGGRYEQVLLDEDFNLLVRDIDADYPVERFSGGEQDDIAVALRIALSRYLAELHQVHESTFLIFDEIFGSQDEERRTNLLSALRTQESRFPQIILISHIPDIQGEFATTYLVEMGPDLSSRVVEVT